MSGNVANPLALLDNSNDLDDNSETLAVIENMPTNKNVKYISKKKSALDFKKIS